MNKTTEALKLAEEALVEYRDNQYIKAPRKALSAIREVLAEQDHSATSSKPITKPVKQDTPYCKSVPMCAKPCGDESCVEPVKQEPIEVTAEYLAEVVRLVKSGNMSLTPIPCCEPVQPVKQEPVCKRCGGWGVVPTGDGYSVDKCPDCEWQPPVQPVSQEPVAWVDAKEEGYEFHGIRELPTGKHHLYAALVDAKAIRAEALEEAAKWFEANGANMMTKDECAAGIRGLK